MLGRAGYSAVLIDLHKDFPRDFRCEKLDGRQIEVLLKTGLAEAVFRASTRTEKLWIVRSGKKLEKAHNGECYFYYDMLVNAVRGEIPPGVDFIESRVDSLTNGPDRQTIKLANGETVSARLAILANGLSLGLRQSLGMEREILSTCHSLSIGFDLAPADGNGFRFPALSYFPESQTDRIAYIAFFPIGPVMRSNMFIYRDMKDPWLDRLRSEPEKTLHRGDARPQAHSRATSWSPTRSRSARSTSMSRSRSCSPAWSWSAMPIRRPVPPRAPASPRRSWISSGCAMSISPNGSKPTAWARKRSRRSTKIRSKSKTKPFVSARHSACAR